MSTTCAIGGSILACDALAAVTALARAPGRDIYERGRAVAQHVSRCFSARDVGAVLSGMGMMVVLAAKADEFCPEQVPSNLVLHLTAGALWCLGFYSVCSIPELLFWPIGDPRAAAPVRPAHQGIERGMGGAVQVQIASELGDGHHRA